MSKRLPFKDPSHEQLIQHVMKERGLTREEAIQMLEEW
jgi:hypothetical protein